jgi:hypothetical protein
VKARSRNPSVTESPHSKRQKNAKAVAATLDEPKTRDSKFRDRCLQRDSHRCVVTGDMDTDYWEKHDRPENTEITRVEAAHIIPFAYASWDKPLVNMSAML